MTPQPVTPRSVSSRVRPASAALAATAATLGFALGVLSTALLAPRDPSSALAAAERADASRGPGAAPAPITARTDD